MTLAIQRPMMAFSVIRWLPADRIAMAASTSTFGLVTLITSFLVFDRE